MSWRDAPLYIEAHDVARWVSERALGFPAAAAPVGGRLVQTAGDLLDAVALALTFPDTRGGHLRAADEAIACLRVQLRLARDLGLVSAGGVRHVAARLAVAGRMIGGWRKRVHDPPTQDPEASTYPTRVPRTASRRGRGRRGTSPTTGSSADGPPPATTA